MKYSIEYTIRATKHITESYLWIKNQAPISADKWRIDLINKVESLSENPKRCPLAPEGKSIKQKSGICFLVEKEGNTEFCLPSQKRKLLFLMLDIASALG